MFVNGEFSLGWDHWSDLGGDLEKATRCLLMVPKKQAHLKQHVAVIWTSFGDDFPVEYRCFPLRYPWSKRHTDNHVLPKPSLNLTLCPDFHHLDTKWSRLILQLWLAKGENSFLSSRIFLGVYSSLGIFLETAPFALKSLKVDQEWISHRLNRLDVLQVCAIRRWKIVLQVPDS